MQIQSTNRPTPSVQKALAESSMEEPAVFMVTPPGYPDLSFGREAYQDTELAKVFGPLITVTAEIIAVAFPKQQNLIHGVGLVLNASTQAGDVLLKRSFGETLKAEDGFKLVKTLVKGASLVVADAPPYWDRSSLGLDWASKTLTLIAQFKDELHPREVTVESTVFDSLKGSPGIELYKAAFGVFKAIFGGLESDRQLLSCPQVSVEEISKSLLSKSTSAWASPAQIYLNQLKTLVVPEIDNA